MSQKVIIIGGGPTGLGAAYRLKELGHENFRLIERSPYLGGLASSFVDEAGFTWDIGGHVMFSHYSYFDDLFDKLMGVDFQMNLRESWVRIHGRMVPYPFQNNIRYLPKEKAYDCLQGLIRAQTTLDPSKTTNFGEFISAVFGEGIASQFMRPYNFKVWAHPPESMNKEWIGERVAVIDCDRALRNVILEQDDFGWGPNNQFKYPLKGGTGEFYRRFASVLDGHYTLGVAVQRIDIHNQTVYFDNGSSDTYDSLISTMPLDLLCNELIQDIDPVIAHEASKLCHSSGYMVGIGIRKPCPSRTSWMYFPEDNCPFYRVTYLNNYSPFMTPKDGEYYSLLCETSGSEHKTVNPDTIVEETVQGLINAGLLKDSDRGDIVSKWQYRAEYSYPIPTIERDSILKKVVPWLDSRGIYSRGRFGMWKYEVSNTDHSVMQGVELVNRLLLNEDETTIGLRYELSEDGRKAAVHERSSLAGSGDPGRRSS